MLPNYLQNKHTAYAFRTLIFFLMLLAASTVYAQDLTDAVSAVSAQTMLVNFAKQVPNLMRMVTAIAYVMGFIFMMRGVVLLKHAGEMRTQMSYEHSLTKPITFLVVGVLLTYIPTAVQMGLGTFWAEPNPYGYLKTNDEFQQFINVCFLIIQFIGTVAFIRGLVILSNLGGHGGQPGTFSRGLTHIIGGVFCINIYQVVQVIIVTLGVQINF